jgi:viroplasmin and RNaseH domain-containing protein
MEDNKGQRDEVYSRRIKAGKRTYFIDVKATRGNDYYITITESKRKEDGYGYAKHKIFLYKEDFNKFMDGLDEVIGYVKNDLMPDYDFERYNHQDHDHDVDDMHTGDGLDKAVDGVKNLTSVNEEAK